MIPAQGSKHRVNDEHQSSMMYEHGKIVHRINDVHPTVQIQSPPLCLRPPDGPTYDIPDALQSTSILASFAMLPSSCSTTNRSKNPRPSPAPLPPLASSSSHSPHLRSSNSRSKHTQHIKPGCSRHPWLHSCRGLTPTGGRRGLLECRAATWVRSCGQRRSEKR